VLPASAPPERSGMASGIASTTRLIGILVGVAGLGAILSAVARRSFVALAAHGGIAPGRVRGLVSHVTSGGLADAVTTIPPAMRQSALRAGQYAFSQGFGTACLAATII